MMICTLEAVENTTQSRLGTLEGNALSWYSCFLEENELKAMVRRKERKTKGLRVSGAESHLFSLFLFSVTFSKSWFCWDLSVPSCYSLYGILLRASSLLSLSHPMRVNTVENSSGEAYLVPSRPAWRLITGSGQRCM